MASTATASDRPKTRVQEVHAELRSRILNGELRPGESLGPAALAKQLGVSLSVVREALTRLAEAGLVLSQPQHGFQVIPISREDLLDLTATRLDIEALTLRRSVEHGDLEWRARVGALHYVLEHTPQFVPDSTPKRLTEEWALAHQAFHAELLSACGSRRLLDFAETLRDSAEVYRRWSTPLGDGSTRDIGGEHRGIVEAVLAGDADLAVERLSAHIAHTTDVLLQHAT